MGLAGDGGGSESNVCATIISHLHSHSSSNMSTVIQFLLSHPCFTIRGAGCGGGGISVVICGGDCGGSAKYSSGLCTSWS